MNPILDGKALDFPINKIVCVGRNYVAHAEELNNAIPEEPLLFIKPSSTLVEFAGDIRIPRGLGAVHHELEIAVLIGENLSASSSRNELMASIKGVGLALDLTLRDVQEKLKNNGYPWERAKSFPESCPLGEFVSIRTLEDLNTIQIELLKNNTLQQSGCSSQMIFSIIELVREVAAVFTLSPGDIILTGTPAGVGRLEAGDVLKATLRMNERDISTECNVRV